MSSAPGSSALTGGTLLFSAGSPEKPGGTQPAHSSSSESSEEEEDAASQVLEQAGCILSGLAAVS